MSDTEDIIAPPTSDSNEYVEEVEEVEYSDVEVEVEASDDYNDAEEETAKTPLKSPSDNKKNFKSPGTPAGSPSVSKGKVQPSESVKRAPMESPESVKQKSSAKFSPDRNPFPAHGNWNTAALNQIDIAFPILTPKTETTNLLTKKNRPEARYWKAPITFKFANFTSNTLRFDNVHIPFHTSKGYGDSFVYMVLPVEASAAFAEAGKKISPTKVTETSLMPDSERWWKIANKVEGLFGVVDGNSKKFLSKSLATIFDSTQSGISATVVLQFHCKASTDDESNLRSTTPRTVSVEVVRGYINEVDLNIQLPRRINRQQAKAEPTVVKKDVASDSLLERLGNLGL